MLPATSNQRANWLAAFSLLALAAIWGATFFMVKDATYSFPVLAFLALRFAIASLALLPFVIRPLRTRRLRRRELAAGIGTGLLFCCGYIFQTFALRTVDSGRVGFITGLYVIFVPFLALVLLRYRLAPRVLFGAVLALIGMILLGYAPGGSLLGDMLAVLCALSFAAHILAIEKLPRSADWRVMALLQSVTVTVVSSLLLPILAMIRACDAPICVSLSPFADTLPTQIPEMVLAVAVFTGLLATAAGLGIQVWAQRLLPPSNAALIFAMESPFSALFGVAFRNEVLTPTGFLGCALIFSGTLSASLISGKREVRATEALEIAEAG
jgi:drug/metabolite transporter (DMT)-like permease